MFSSEIFRSIVSVPYRSAASGCILGYTHVGLCKPASLALHSQCQGCIWQGLTMLSVRLWFLIFIIAPAGQAVLADPSLLGEGSSRGRDCDAQLDSSGCLASLRVSDDFFPPQRGAGRA